MNKLYKKNKNLKKNCRKMIKKNQSEGLKKYKKINQHNKYKIKYKQLNKKAKEMKWI